LPPLSGELDHSPTPLGTTSKPAAVMREKRSRPRDAELQRILRALPSFYRFAWTHSKWLLLCALGTSLGSGAVQGLAVTFLPSVLSADNAGTELTGPFGMIALMLLGAALQSFTQLITLQLWIDLRMKGRANLLAVSREALRRQGTSDSRDASGPIGQMVFNVVRSLNGSLMRASLGTRQVLGASFALITACSLIAASIRLNALTSLVVLLPILLAAILLVRMNGSRLLATEQSLSQSKVEDKTILQQLMMEADHNSKTPTKVKLPGDLVLYSRVRTPQTAKVTVLLVSLPLVGIPILLANGSGSEAEASSTIILVGALLLAVARLAVSVESLTRITRFTFHLAAFENGVVTLKKCTNHDDLMALSGQLGDEDDEMDY